MASKNACCPRSHINIYDVEAKCRFHIAATEGEKVKPWPIFVSLVLLAIAWFSCSAQCDGAGIGTAYLPYFISVILHFAPFISIGSKSKWVARIILGMNVILILIPFGLSLNIFSIRLSGDYYLFYSTGRSVFVRGDMFPISYFFWTIGILNTLPSFIHLILLGKDGRLVTNKNNDAAAA